MRKMIVALGILALLVVPARADALLDHLIGDARLCLDVMIPGDDDGNLCLPLGAPTLDLPF